MKRSLWAGWVVVATSCATDPLIGTYESTSDQQPISGAGGSLGQGGANFGEGSDAGSSGGRDTTDEAVPWFVTSFEDDESPAHDEFGEMRTVGSGELSVVQSIAHQGQKSLRTTLTARGGYLFYFVPVPSRFSASMYLYVPESFDTQTIVVQKILRRVEVTSSEEHVFDVNIQLNDQGKYQLVLFDHATTDDVGRSEQSFAVETWVKIGVEFVASLEGLGKMIVLLDDEEVIDIGAVDTFAGDSEVLFGIGSIAQSIAPAPAELYFDDLRVDAL